MSTTILLLLAAAPQSTAPPVLEPLDVYELEWASDPRLSPDGSQVVHRRVWSDVMSDRTRGDLWRIDLETGATRPIARDASSPRWSPDGTRIAYVSDGDDGAEIFVRWLDGGDVVQVTRLPGSPSELTWSPDGERLAFTMEVPLEADPMIALPPRPAGADWAPEFEVIEHTAYRSDGRGFVDEADEHVFVVPSRGGTARQLTRGRRPSGSGLAWTPDGSELVFSVNLREDREIEVNDTDLYALRVSDGRLRRLTDRYGPDDLPAISPDGRWLAYVGYDEELQGYQVPRLHVLDLAEGGAPRVLAHDLDRRPTSPQWSDDGAAIRFTFDDRGERRLGEVDVATGERRVLASGLGSGGSARPYGGGSFHGAGGRIVYTSSTPSRPADVVLVDRDGSRRRLTALNEDLLPHRSLGRVVEFWTKSGHDELDVQAWAILPPGHEPGERRPTLLEIHGGPFANYGPTFSFELQLYAAAGYVVVYANPRGSSSYGAAFGNEIHHAYPGHDYDDLMSVVDAAVARGWADPERLYVTGGSGGGVLTAWIVGTTDRFRAAVVAKPVINWISFALTADAYRYFWRWWFPGHPWDHFEHYWERSPLSRVGNVSTPTMLLTGEQDYRTPISESEQYYQALRLRGVDTAFVRIPEASHGIARRPSHLVGKVLHVLAWFERYDGPSASWWK